MCAQVPECYRHNPPRLQPGYFGKFAQETLFYIFYSMPGDEAQVPPTALACNAGCKCPSSIWNLSPEI
jgi:CCR4-NOT transcription complex subunit 2